MMLSLLHHCLYCGLGVAIVLLLESLMDRRRGLSVSRGLRRRLPTALVVLAVFVTWDMLPMAWHLPLAVTVGVLCMAALFRDALRSSGSPGPSDAKPGQGTASQPSSAAPTVPHIRR